MKLKHIIFLLNFILVDASGFAQDTLRVMTYNVLHYGDRCQGSNSFLHNKLKTIIQFEKPDVLGLVKVQSIKISATDFTGISAVGFADSILVNAMNAAYANQYDYCPIINFSGDPDDDMDLLFYNKSKLGFLSVVNLCSVQEDFNLYKLYYKDPNLATTKDSTFLYFILNHTVSGDASGSRDQQDSLVVKSLKKRFSQLPNLISMGDFNTHSSYEPGYQLLTSTSDTSFLFSDPPFFPDTKVTYPSSWEFFDESLSSLLNTSTRKITTPNTCGTTGGAKDWYLHILLSPWLVKNKDYIKYVPNSYSTIGNDGKRLSISINDSSSGKNTSVPPDVLDALFQLSDKYPIMIKLAVTSNGSGVSPADPELNTITEVTSLVENIGVSNPVEKYITYFFPTNLLNEQVSVEWFDCSGRLLEKSKFEVNGDKVNENINLSPGVYILQMVIKSIRRYFRIVKI